MKQTVAAFIAKTLEQAGVKRIWGVTGDSLNGLSDSLNRMERSTGCQPGMKKLPPSPQARKRN